MKIGAHQKIKQLLVVLGLSTAAAGTFFDSSSLQAASKKKQKQIAKDNKTKPAKAVAKKTKPKAIPAEKVKALTPPLTAERKLKDLKSDFRKGELSEGRFFYALDAFSQDGATPAEQKAEAYSIQAKLLERSDYPLLSGLYAAESIKIAKGQTDKNVQSDAWEALHRSSRRTLMHELLISTARTYVERPLRPSGFGSDWYYFTGLAALDSKKPDIAADLFNKVNADEPHHFAARYQLAMMALQKGDTQRAETLLKALIIGADKNFSKLPDATNSVLVDYANLALARIQYQQKDFLSSIKSFRAVSKEGPLFYDSLFEQAWALFLAGFPNHALGMLHGAESPFYKDVFNPEVTMLRSIVFYWMCRYEDSRAALADFSDRHADAVEGMRAFLGKRFLDSETAYQLFEDYVSGVSTKSLGISKPILESVTTQESMMSLREQYANAVAEAGRLKSIGLYQDKKSPDVGEKLLKAYGKTLRLRLGDQLIAELRELKTQYDQLSDQSQFLYVELLMSEKEQLLGRELHASTKIDRISQQKNISGWAKKSMAWSDDGIKEYWWDEVGYHIYKAEPMCNVSRN